jgi:hypothetical protein
MPRTYSIDVIALVIGSAPKWVDNLLSHHALPGASRGRQGVQRRITDEGLLAIELTRLLACELAVPLGRSAELARRVLASRSASEVTISTGSGLTLVFSLSAIENRLRARVLEAVESVARVPRGRPRKDGAFHALM